jgi:hypothetical protein
MHRGDRPVLKQQSMPVPAVIVPVYTMGMAREEMHRSNDAAGGVGNAPFLFLS